MLSLFFFFGYMQPSYVSGFSWNLGASVYCRTVTSIFPPCFAVFPSGFSIGLDWVPFGPDVT